MKSGFALIGLGVLMLASSGVAEAKGCISGAAVGAVAGHVAGRHAVIGAAAGCVINHHRNKVKDERDEAARSAQAAEANRPRVTVEPPPPR